MYVLQASVNRLSIAGCLIHVRSESFELTDLMRQSAKILVAAAQFANLGLKVGVSENEFEFPVDIVRPLSKVKNAVYQTL